MNDRDTLENISIELFGNNYHSNKEVMDEVKHINRYYWDQDELKEAIRDFKKINVIIKDLVDQWEPRCKSL